MQVNLLDNKQDPTDEQLAWLMGTVTAEARVKAAAADAQLKATMSEELAQARRRFQGVRRVVAEALAVACE